MKVLMLLAVCLGLLEIQKTIAEDNFAPFPVLFLSGSVEMQSTCVTG